MSVYSDVLNSVIELMEETKPYARIVVGSNVPANGICVLPTPATSRAFLDKNTDMEWIIALNGKNADQLTVFEALSKIHTSLTRKKDYPSDTNYQIYDISAVAGPRLIGRQENDQWIYGSSLRIRFYMRGE